LLSKHTTKNGRIVRKMKGEGKKKKKNRNVIEAKGVIFFSV
jgi:hypothetical protein